MKSAIISEPIYTQKFQKAGMSTFDKFIHYLHLHDYFENEFLDFSLLRNKYLQPLIFT